MDWSDNKLTDEIKSQLRQGTKIKFKWYGNSKMEYVGRIEVDRWGNLYFANEFCYENDVYTYPGSKFYNSLESFNFFTMFEIIEQPK